VNIKCHNGVVGKKSSRHKVRFKHTLLLELAVNFDQKIEKVCGCDFFEVLFSKFTYSEREEIIVVGWKL